MNAVLDFLIMVSSFAAAWFWFQSSTIKFSFGFDMDTELQTAFNKAAGKNKLAAIFSGIAALATCIKYGMAFFNI